MLFQSIVFTREDIKYLKIFFQILQVRAKVALNRQAIHSKLLIHLCGTNVISYDNTSFDNLFVCLFVFFPFFLSAYKYLNQI